IAGDRDRKFEIGLDDHRQELTIPKDRSEVMRQIDLSAHLKSGTHKLTVTESTGTGSGFQAAFRFNVPAPPDQPKSEPLAVELTYARTELKVGKPLAVTCRVTDNLPVALQMVMLDLPIPAGFTPDTTAFDQMVKAKTIERFQVTPRQIIVYLRGLEPAKTLELKSRVRANVPATLTVPAARAYEYYAPDRQGRSTAVKLVVGQ